ncbi:hypothetical protein [Terriglobus sp. RCC_193]|uniref:hypothetical protein n=1 Tax=Terriglobus sp. RCC_193 TaxID=3239218 RepID=UPI0035234EEA
MKVLLLAVIHLGFMPVTQGQATTDASSAVATWSTVDAKHVYGFPDTKANKKGKLVLSADSLVFTAKSSNTSIPRSSIVAVSNGSDRVEIWGMTGQIVRMVIPDGGGLAAAAVMHHRVGMLTVDFVDGRGGKHSAVFNMSPVQAEAGLATFQKVPVAIQRSAVPKNCAGVSANPGSVSVMAPNWEGSQVPAAYRALVYEHVISRLQGVKTVSHVYRDGEVPPDGSCPAYTIKIRVQAFKQGNQVYRAALGPVGMFVGTTQVTFDVNLTDATGHLDQREQVKASIRMQSESTEVADKFAKALAKHYVASLKREESTVRPVAAVGQNAFR